MTDQILNCTRRSALLSAAGFGLSVTFLGRQAFAASDDTAKRKLIVIICRGAMDGLSVSPPIGDPDYASLRTDIAIPGFGQTNGALKINDTFGLHPKLAALHRMVLAGQARIAPAIATPDRARSHFEAQDVLESGVNVVYGTSSGWLNRALEAVGPLRKIEALSVGPQAPLILRGKIEVASWSAGGPDLKDVRLPQILADLYANDPMLGPALASGLETQAMGKLAQAAAKSQAMPVADANHPMTMTSMPPVPAMAAAQNAAQQGEQARLLARTLAKFMVADNGPSIAALSLDGFDTHFRQGASEGQLAQRLLYLDAVLDGLSTGMDSAWPDTVVLVATEFGRTARMNGTGGTDHGTASTALLLGGAIKPGGIIGDWPTLKSGKLFENRDTAPTVEMRALFKGVLAQHMGIDRRALDQLVFPESQAIRPLDDLIA
jgi:uncharacterized protein (DUF1501 family)